MKAPPLPIGEAARLEDLRSYQVLDSGPDEGLDAVTRLVAQLLRVPIALVSLVDAERQWFKSRHGLEACETGRDVSFCAYVVAAGAPLMVPDAHIDARFSDNPLVTGPPHVRFYAGVPLRSPRGHVLGTLCAIDDVPRAVSEGWLEQLTQLAVVAQRLLDQHRAVHALDEKYTKANEAARQFEALFETMAEGVVVQDRSGAIVACNGSAGDILGLTTDELVGRTSRDPRWRAIQEDGSDFPGDIHPAMMALREGRASRNVVMGVHKPGGSLSWISINAVPVGEPGTPPSAAITTFHDISIIKQTQLVKDQLAQKERLITAGTLAAGVGHEINNPLMFVLGNLELALEEVASLAGGSPSARMRDLLAILEDARSGAERIKNVVRALRALARQTSDPVGCEVDKTVALSINIANHELRTRATLTTELEPTPPVAIDASRLSQVLVNLLVNAAQAFSDRDLERNHIWLSARVHPSGSVQICVRDNGPGIPQEVQGRVYDPFFTTKPVGVGTGLGLSICHTIVTSVGGSIRFDSSPEGTCFEVLLPIMTDPDHEELGSHSPTKAGPYGVRGKVLVLDDDEAVARTVRRMLSSEHDVVVCTDPRQGLALLTSGGWFDVVFCDLAMPYLTGDEVFRHVKESAPEQAERFVFITGGATDDRGTQFLEMIETPHLEKPLNTDEVRAIARRLVGEVPRSGG